MMRAEHQQEIGRITSDLEDETCSRFDMDKRVAEMRKEVSTTMYIIVCCFVLIECYFCFVVVFVFFVF